jgi:hypothetical protein
VNNNKGNSSNESRQPQSANNRATAQISLDNISQAMSRWRTAGAYTTISRQVKAAQIHRSHDQIKHGRAELDTHADTCGLNDVAKVLEYTGQVAEVSGFANSMQAIRDVPIVKAALAYDDSDTGETIILIINQGLYFGDQLDEILLNPNQIREYGHTVNDVPKRLGGTTHSIISCDNQINIPLSLWGVISYFPVGTPTSRELENCTSITLTSDMEWHPYSENFEEEERKYTNQVSHNVASVATTFTTSYDPFADDIIYKRMLAAQTSDLKINTTDCF